MIEYIIAAAIMLLFTALAFRKNAVAMLSIAFTLIYVVEIILYSISQTRAYDFFLLFGSEFPPTWNIYTAIFLHSLSPAHIFFNILFFFLAGMPFESRIGSRRFTLIFLISGILANLGFTLFLYLSGVNSILIGASGAIFGIMGAFVVMYPNDEIAMFLGPILMPRVKVKYAILALIIIEFAASMLWVNDNVAHGAHVIGAVTGALMGSFYARRGIKEKRDRNNLNHEVFETLADSPKLSRIYERIMEEEDKKIREAWILEFFRERFGDAKIEGDFVISGGKRYRIYR